ncbi:hypothetical protein GCM10010439_73290 [Actinocorallia aurantiaca]|uniref:Uncharacterized protein n=1 Tax=Actinocorallia aurantiaca TaxID=46204 RepID=A0ABP6H9D2_9ACTN
MWANVIKPAGEQPEPFCRVQNQDVGDLAEHVTCSDADGELHYCWSWGDPIAPVRHVEAAAEWVAYALRLKDPAP